MMSSSYCMPSGTAVGSYSANTPLTFDVSKTAIPVTTPLPAESSTSRYESNPAALINGDRLSSSSKFSFFLLIAFCAALSLSSANGETSDLSDTPKAIAVLIPSRMSGDAIAC